MNIAWIDHDQDERERAFLVFGRIVEGIAVNGVLHVPSKPYQLELPALARSFRPRANHTTRAVSTVATP